VFNYNTLITALAGFDEIKQIIYYLKFKNILSDELKSDIK